MEEDREKQRERFEREKARLLNSYLWKVERRDLAKVFDRMSQMRVSSGPKTHLGVLEQSTQHAVEKLALEIGLLAKRIEALEETTQSE